MDSTAYVSDYSSKEKRFLRITFVTICSLFLLILAGGVVRSTGSGMGCPDWPKCFDHWVPPTEVSQLPADYQEKFVEKRVQKNQRFAKLLDALGQHALADQIRNDSSILKTEEFNVFNTYTEYVNRLMGALTGLFMLAMTIAAIPLLKNNRDVFWICFTSLVLVVFQAWLGSIVVSTNLVSWTITVHMVTALVILALVILAYSIVKYKHLEVARLSVRKLRIASMVAWLSLVLTGFQIVWGTEVREAVDYYSTFWNGTNRGAWLELTGFIFKLHRSFSILVIIIAVFITWYVHANFGAIKRLKRFANASILFLLVQLLTGIILANFDIPPVFQTLHLVSASFLVGAQVMLIIMINIYKRNISIELIS